MIVDSRTIPSGTVIRADLCIMGGGAAGIAIAREFVNHPWRVLLGRIYNDLGRMVQTAGRNRFRGAGLATE